MEAHARTQDPRTSHAAAATVDFTDNLWHVLKYLRHKAHRVETFDREELARDMAGIMSAQSARSRLAELMRAGYAVDTGTRRRTTLGGAQQVLIAKQAAITDEFDVVKENVAATKPAKPPTKSELAYQQGWDDALKHVANTTPATVLQ